MLQGLAYVSFKAEKRKFVVPISDIENFNPQSYEDFDKEKLWNVKWPIEREGSSLSLKFESYPANILLLAGSKETLILRAKEANMKLPRGYVPGKPSQSHPKKNTEISERAKKLQAKALDEKIKKERMEAIVRKHTAGGKFQFHPNSVIKGKKTGESGDQPPDVDRNPTKTELPKPQQVSKVDPKSQATETGLVNDDSVRSRLRTQSKKKVQKQIFSSDTDVTESYESSRCEAKQWMKKVEELQDELSKQRRMNRQLQTELNSVQIQLTKCRDAVSTFSSTFQGIFQKDDRVEQWVKSTVDVRNQHNSPLKQSGIELPQNSPKASGTITPRMKSIPSFIVTETKKQSSIPSAAKPIPTKSPINLASPSLHQDSSERTPKATVKRKIEFRTDEEAGSPKKRRTQDPHTDQPSKEDTTDADAISSLKSPLKKPTPKKSISPLKSPLKKPTPKKSSPRKKKEKTSKKQTLGSGECDNKSLAPMILAALKNETPLQKNGNDQVHIGNNVWIKKEVWDQDLMAGSDVTEQVKLLTEHVFGWVQCAKYSLVGGRSPKAPDSELKPAAPIASVQAILGYCRAKLMNQGMSVQAVLDHSVETLGRGAIKAKFQSCAKKLKRENEKAGNFAKSQVKQADKK